MSSLLLRNALLADGTTVDVRIADGVVAAVAATLAPQQGDDVVELDHRLLLPAAAEPHAHLDKAFLAEIVPNPTGDLLGAIVAMNEHRHLITQADTAARAERAARLMVANGTTAIRTHADLNPINAMTSINALLDVRDRLADLVDIQVIALCGSPMVGAEGAEERALLRDAIAAGIDGIGGCPHLEPESAAATDVFVEIAGEAGLPLDLHTDETLNPEMLAVEHLAERVVATGFAHAVAASHCVSLGMQSEARQREVAEKVAAAGISVIALPSSNLFLQGRDHQQGMPRALTPVRALRAAGVNVAAGADNLQDPFNPMGRGDPWETASLMVMAGHLLPHEAFAAVTSAARRAIGVPAVGLTPGDPADLVAVHAGSLREAIAYGSPERMVIRRGRVLAHSG